jgi:hypothetical protein
MLAITKVVENENEEKRRALAVLISRQRGGESWNSSIQPFHHDEDIWGIPIRSFRSCFGLISPLHLKLFQNEYLEFKLDG